MTITNNTVDTNNSTKSKSSSRREKREKTFEEVCALWAWPFGEPLLKAYNEGMISTTEVSLGLLGHGVRIESIRAILGMSEGAVLRKVLRNSVATKAVADDLAQALMSRIVELEEELKALK